MSFLWKSVRGALETPLSAIYRLAGFSQAKQDEDEPPEEPATSRRSADEPQVSLPEKLCSLEGSLAHEGPQKRPSSSPIFPVTPDPLQTLLPATDSGGEWAALNTETLWEPSTGVSPSQEGEIKDF